MQIAGVAEMMYTKDDIRIVDTIIRHFFTAHDTLSIPSISILLNRGRD